MIKVHSYLNFNGNCEEAFAFYQSVFEVESMGIYRYGDMPADPNLPLKDADKDKVMHTSLQINDAVMLMGCDIIEGFGQKAVFGTGTCIMLDTDTPEQARALHANLSAQAKQIEMDLDETFFAELFSSFIDRFGIAWMIYFEGNKKMD